jgi:putative ABC transport system permease protein
MRASGVDAEYQVTGSVNLEIGRFFATQELMSARPVCVIGYDIWDQLFHKANPLGQQIRVNGYPLEVVGVAKQVGGLFGVFSIDHEVMMPLRTLLSAFGDPHRSFTIAVKAKDVVNKEDTKAEAAYQMRMVRGLKPTEADDFAINSQDQFNKAFDALTLTLNMIGFVITSLSLIVGGIGIMNIMFVSVKERTREIGIRKAIGARRRVILTQFLTEATMLCVIAGLIGLALAYGISQAVNHTMLSDSTVKVVFSPSLIVTAMGLSLFIGLLSGLLPAWRASRLDPVDALRYE